MLNYFTAIGFDKDKKPYKYRNIKLNNVGKFEEFLKSKNIIYINYYFKTTKQFSHRQYIND